MAILANELRIGNFICTLIDPGQCRPKELRTIQILNGDHLSHLLNEHPEHRIYEIEPIPLTPEILESYKVMYKHFADEFFIRIVSGGVLIGQRQKGIKYLKHIKYLHQLQNLYFALTGEELTINL